MSNGEDRILLVIPEYNDSERLKPFLSNLLKELPREFDILIVDDGSTPKEKKLLDEMVMQKLGTPSNPKLLPPLSYKQNQGKGAAIRKGFAMRKGYHKYIAFVDADGAISPKEIVRLKSIMVENPELDAILASRAQNKGTKIERSWIRGVIGWLFSKTIHWITNLNITDTQCGLKYFSAEAYKKMEPHLQINGFPIDIEICYLLKYQKHKYREIPISWKEIGGSKVRILQDSLNMLWETFKIKYRIRKINNDEK